MKAEAPLASTKADTMNSTIPKPAAASLIHMTLIPWLVDRCSISVLAETQEQKVIELPRTAEGAAKVLVLRAKAMQRK